VLVEVAALELAELSAEAVLVPLRVVAEGAAVVAAAEAGTEVTDAVEAVTEAPVEAAPVVMVTGRYMVAMSPPVKVPLLVPGYRALTPPMVSTQSATFGLLMSHRRWIETLQYVRKKKKKKKKKSLLRRERKKRVDPKNLQVLVVILELGGFWSGDSSQSRRDTTVDSISACRTIDEESGS
jgi:hypothetical protein